MGHVCYDNEIHDFFYKHILLLKIKLKKIKIKFLLDNLEGIKSKIQPWWGLLTYQTPNIWIPPKIYLRHCIKCYAYKKRTQK